MTNERKGRLFAIGDIHGDFKGLVNVFNQMLEDGFDLNSDSCVQVGDMIDGGPHSMGVVNLLYHLQTSFPNFHVLLGNHEDMLLEAIGKNINYEAFQLWWYQGGEATYNSYGDPSRDFLDSFARKLFEPVGKLKEHTDWFHTLPLTFETDEFIFVHAGLLPNMTVEATPRETRLWIRHQFINSGYDWGKVVVYGHTARRNLLIERNKIGIDCMWHGDGRVAAVELEGRTVKNVYGLDN